MYVAMCKIECEQSKIYNSEEEGKVCKGTKINTYLQTYKEFYINLYIHTKCVHAYILTFL